MPVAEFIVTARAMQVPSTRLGDPDSGMGREFAEAEVVLEEGEWVLPHHAQA